MTQLVAPVTTQDSNRSHQDVGVPDAITLVVNAIRSTTSKMTNLSFFVTRTISPPLMDV